MTKRFRLLTIAAALASLLTGCAVVPLPVATYGHVQVQRPMVVVPAPHRHGHDGYQGGRRYSGRW